ncbi:MAG: HlyD family efflux transporter periplasmic adaptor subunit [Hyphomonadaceae bacterium]|jgi:HlyD family secretion protein|nr:HlyD family efflux transporter periplasmic adaptor subunit [Hyphomonadaceae bacterium]
MAMPGKRTLAILGLAGVVAAGATGWAILRPKGPEALTLYGNVEARDVPVAFRQGGRIAEILVEEGASVTAGQVLARLETSTFDDALAAANAEIGVAEAELARISAPARPQEIAQAAAGVDQARAALTQNSASLAQNAANLRQAEASVAQTAAAQRQADAALRQAEAVLANAQTDYERQQSLVGDGSVSERTRDAALERRNVARAQRDAAAAQRDTAASQAASAAAGRDAVLAQRQSALGARDGLEAGLNAASQSLSLRREGARAVDIQGGRARVAAADASRQRVARALDDTDLRAPSDGVILSRMAEPGALVQAGTPVVSLGLGAPVYVRAYVDAPNLGRVGPGTTLEVRSDTSDTVWTGQVGFVSPRAEFTPKTVETEDLRTDLVYRIRIVIPGDGRQDGVTLLPGMPVTVRLPARAGQ